MERIFLEQGNLVVKDRDAIQLLKEKHYGELKNGKLFLQPEEALYLMEIRNWRCFSGVEELEFSKLSSLFLKSNRKLFVRYNTYRDWRDRGLFIRNFESGKYGKLEKVIYPSKNVQYPKLDLTLKFFPFDLISIIDEGKKFFHLFKDFWLGQLGVYKNYQKGKLLKFDIFETVFLLRNCGARVVNLENEEELNEEKIFKLSKSEDVFKALYEVYEDWRLRGFVLKTGYKFGAHFRIYFPGVSPIKKGKKWIHSKHVLHVFPKFERMLVSEWSRVVRVAHSVRKTFVFGIPGMKEEDFEDVELDFLGWHREEGRVLTPEENPNYVILALGEDEFLGGAELASALRKAEEVGLDLLLAINGRESDVTYYMVKQIELPGSKYQYYEMRWIQP